MRYPRRPVRHSTHSPNAGLMDWFQLGVAIIIWLVVVGIFWLGGRK